MGWEKREAVSDLVILGDEQGNKKSVGGLLVALPHDKGYDKTNYQIVKQSGEEVTVSGSRSIARQISANDVGKFVKFTFTGWGNSPNGKFKAIEVNVWEGEPTPEMKAWPRFADLQKGNGKPPVATKTAVASSLEEDFPGALEETDDDLPF